MWRMEQSIIMYRYCYAVPFDSFSRQSLIHTQTTHTSGIYKSLYATFACSIIKYETFNLLLGFYSGQFVVSDSQQEKTNQKGEKQRAK